MPDLLREKTVTARKPHACATCTATAIKPGETYTRATYAYDGRVYDWVQCTDCKQLADPVFGWTLDADCGIGAEDYLEWAREHVDDPNWGERAAAYLRRATGSEEER